MPTADHERSLRVTLNIDGDERTEYEGTLAADMHSVMIIPLSSHVEGELECRVYLDGELFSEETVTLY